jgi:hypothetical protein
MRCRCRCGVPANSVVIVSLSLSFRDTHLMCTFASIWVSFFGCHCCPFSSVCAYATISLSKKSMSKVRWEGWLRRVCAIVWSHGNSVNNAAEWNRGWDAGGLLHTHTHRVTRVIIHERKLFCVMDDMSGKLREYHKTDN